ncbi:AI-2E family transporter [Microlunatus soli]|uniref:Predicted PurR-regulated permease PerM n=1 Tax=Microlunatus soli TaxID=630515 RepID=A0A1H1YQV1_9ACTN|nr:AI-2E family transporter [Microlunatus soli]SDT23669.1 Predicted PurR-regulated permease PerM [Microlunatus soli]
MATEQARTTDDGAGTADRSGVPLPLWGVLVAAGLVILCAGLREVADIIAPIFLMVTLVITVHPLRKVLLRWHFPNWLASLLVLIVIYLMMAVILGAVALSVTQLALQLPNYQKAFESLYDWALGTLRQFGVDTSDWRGMLSKIDIGSFTGAAQGVLAGVTSAFSLVGLMALTVIFLAFDGAGARARMLIVRRLKPGVADAFADFAHRVRSYWIVTTVFGLIVAGFDVIALLIMGVPLALTWGVLAFVSNYIPNVGFIIGLIPPVVIALLESGPGMALAVAITYAVINFFIQTLIQPRFTGDAAGINATIAFISLIFWASILGPLGALLAVPATLFVKVVLIDHSPNARWFGALINSDSDDKPKPKKRKRSKPTPPAVSVEGG